LLVSKKLAEIIYHIQLVHDISVETDEDPTFSEKETKMPSFLYSIVRRTDKVLFPCAFKWTLKFCEENFSDHLFDDLAFSQSNWPLLPPETATTHLPTMNESCDVARIPIQSFVNPLNDDYSFKKYKLFESELHENKTTLFCGGPISSMAWLPTPYTKTIENQILAVSVLNSPDEKYVTNDNYEVASAIQFWNFGTLKSSQASLREPKLAFSIAHNHGPVWHMEWCPSGCYNFSEEKVNRMGLLAATGSDSIVYIYSVPFFNEEEMGLFYKPKPVMKLLLQRPGSALLGGHKYYPTRISWSKASGHRYVVVGYTNGFIGLFNIKNNSAILKYKDADGVTCILPNKCFQGHSHSITGRSFPADFFLSIFAFSKALALYHLKGGCRWLMSGSIDRGVSLWDLDNHNYPMCTTRKNIVTDGFWLTNWLCYVTAMDEGSTSMHVTAMLKQARDYVCDSNVSLTCSPSTISSISGSDWLNGVVHGNTVGEIVAIFPHQILQTPEHQKLFKSKRMLFGYTYLIEKNKSPAERTEEDEIRKRVLQNLMTKKLSAGVKLSKIKSDIDCSDLFLKEPLTYQEAEEKYALLFCDNKLKSYDDFVKTTAKQLTAFSKSYAVTHPNQYPLTTLNKIVFNPNRQASLYYATGYQAGFVRVSWLEFLKDDHQIK
jgi:WD40 repeat protein